MGGKAKQSQRTKNNVRPSSSGRSAEHLNQAVKLDPTLISTGEGKILPALFPSLTITNFDHGLNKEFSLCLKKLNKKDPITKTKALKELTELVNTSEADDIVAALNGWTHFYKILSTDTNHKVRENTQVCHGAIVRVCGRRIAPHLKNLLPSWLTAQYDDYAPVATAAQYSLTSTFPNNKLPEVISFCKSEVVAHLLNNLLTPPADSVPVNKTEDVEERELLYCRVLTCSLHGLQYVCEWLPSEHDTWLWDQLDPLLKSAIFWKSAGHADHQLRAAWFGVMEQIICRFHAILSDVYGQKLTRILMMATKEKSGVAADRIWSCLLAVMQNLKDWHKWVDNKDLLCKRIIDLLESGGWGSARHLSSLLLPLLGHLPRDLLTADFYRDFFNSIFSGLEKRSVLSSKSEQKAWLTSLSECLQYLSTQHNEYVVEMTTSVHRIWLEKVTALSSQHDSSTRTNLVKCSVTNMTSLLKYWLKQSNEECNEKWDSLIRNFWQNIGSTVLIQIESVSTEEDTRKLIEIHILILQTLKASFLQEPKAQPSIRFSDEVEPESKDNAIPPPECDKAIVDRFTHNLNELVQKVASQYLKLCDLKGICDPIMSPLKNLLVEFDSKNLFESLAKHFNRDLETHGLYEVFVSWLHKDTMRCKAVVEVLFLMMMHLSESAQQALLGSIQMLPQCVLEWCISLSLSHPYRSSKMVQGWMKDTLIEKTLLNVCQRMIEHDDCSAEDLLLSCLTPDAKVELPVSEETVSKTLAALTTSLAAVDPPVTLERTARTATRLLRTLGPLAPRCDLIYALLRLNLLNQREEGKISAETWSEVWSTWQEALLELQPDHRDELICRALTLVRQQLFLDTENLNIEYIEHLATVTPYLMIQFDNPHLSETVIEIVRFTRQLFDFEKSNTESLLKTHALRYDCIVCKTNCPIEDNEAIKKVIEESSELNVKELSKSILIEGLRVILFQMTYLKSILTHSSKDKPSEELGYWTNQLLQDEYLISTLNKMLHDCAIVDSLHEGYSYWLHYDVINMAKQRLDELVIDISRCTAASEGAGAVLTAGARLAAEHGYYWCYGAARIAHMLRDNTETGEGQIVPWTKSQSELSSDDYSSSNGFIHSLQASTKYSEDLESILRVKYQVMVRSFFCAHQSIPGVLATYTEELSSCLPNCNLDVIVNTYYRHNETMLYDREINDADWRQVVSNVTIVEFLTEMVKQRGWEAPAHHWDFCTISLCSLIESLQRSKNHWGSTKVAMLAHSVFLLYVEVQQFVAGVRAECERRVPTAHVAHLPAEWDDIFAPDLTYNLMLILLHVLEHGSEEAITVAHARYLAGLAKCVQRMDWGRVPAARLSDAGGTLSLRRVVQSVMHVLRQPIHYGYKYLAHYTLNMIADPLVLGDAEKLSSWISTDDTETEEPQPAPELWPAYCQETMDELQDLMEAALGNIVEQSYEIVPGTDTHSMALGYLLLAHALLSICDRARGDLTIHYIELFRKHKYASSLVAMAMRLVPPEVAAYSIDPGQMPSPDAANLFQQTEKFSIDVAMTELVVASLACRCIFLCLGGAGAGDVRSWWGAAEVRVARALARLTAAFVAPTLIADQLKYVQRHQQELDDTQITIHWSTNEVVCEFFVEDRPVELTVTFSPQHPLVPPRAPPSPPPAPNNQWIALYLAYQNGSLLNALKMWTRAVTRRVEKAPQCYVCYCRLQPGTGHLPRVPCHQCKNKFHMECVRKWFAVSNKSNCPLCRAPF